MVSIVSLILWVHGNSSEESRLHTFMVKFFVFEAVLEFESRKR